MEEKTKAVRRTELVLVVLLLLVFLIPQVLGSKENDEVPREDVIHGPEDLKQGTFACVMGSSYDAIIPKLFPEAEIKYVADWADECIQVEQGKADAILWEASSLNEMHNTYPALTELPDPVGALQFHWCCKKDERGNALKEEINAFVRSLRETGELEKIYEKWENPDAAPDRVEEYERTVPVRGKIRTVSAMDWAPVCYMNNGNPCGFMVELLYRFAAGAGYELEEEYVDLQSMIAGFYAGKYDLIAYGVEYSPERADVVNYTEPLMSDDIYVVVQKARAAAFASGESGKTDSGEKGFLEKLQVSLEKNFLRENRWLLLLKGLGITVLLSVMSISLGTALGGVICGLRMNPKPLPQAVGRVYIRGVESMPIVLMLLIFYYVVFRNTNIDPFWICVICFSMDFSAYASEMFRSGILAVPDGQKRASRALGFTGSETFRHVVFPQMVIHCLPTFMGQVISTVKLTSVAGYISVMDLTRVSDLIRSRTYEAFPPLIFTALVYFLLAGLLTRLLKILSGRLDPARKKRQIRGVKIHAD
ncbi:MAG: ABC transporter permease subunit [Clostridiales bacterium]|nr:ABC transporter permease subunit [Clostridiales bacterium]